MVSLLKTGRKKKKDSASAQESSPAPQAQATTQMESPAEALERDMAPASDHAIADAHAPDRSPATVPTRVQPLLQSGPTTYTPPDGADDFQLPARHIAAEPPPSADPATGSGGLFKRVLLFSGEQTPEERDRVAAQEFEHAMAPVMDYMRAAVPEASTPEEAARILGENQGEITPDPQGGSYVNGDAFDNDARVYYRLLRRNYEKNPRPSESDKKKTSPHLHQVYGKLIGTKGW